MRTLSADLNNDLIIGADGSLAFSLDAEAVSENAVHAAKTLRNEMIQEYDLGIPFFIVAFGANVTIPQFEAATKARILQAEGVTGIRSFETIQNGDVLGYTAFIEHIYGSSVING